MKKFRSILVVLVVFSILATSFIPAFAETPTATTTSAPATAVASDSDIAASVGLIRGSGNGVTPEYLASVSKRYQAAIMFLRLKGLETEATNFTGTDNFADAKALSAGNQKILAYLKAHPELGWVGSGNNTFDPTSDITAQQFYKVLLETLGYKAGTDFNYAETIKFAAANRMSKVASSKKFTNDNMASATVEALKTSLKGSDLNLISSLVKANVVSEDKIKSTGLALLPGYKIVGYLPAWKNWVANDVYAEKLTHINLAFATIKDGVIDNGKDLKQSHFDALNALKLQYPHLKTLISVGGYGGDGFSDAALTEESRNKFADSVVTYLRKNNLDGVDVDWEYPVNGGWGTIKARPEDKTNYTLFMKAINDKIDAAAKEDNKNYLLTYCASANPSYLTDWTEATKVIAIADFTNIMYYDIHGTWEKTTGHLASLGLNAKDTQGISGESTVENFIKAGIPAEKMVFGVPFYGVLWTNVNKENNGVYQNVYGEGKTIETYTDITINYTPKQGYTRYWDDTAKAAYLWNAAEGNFVTYEDTQAIDLKIKYVIEKKLGGAMFWEYTQDAESALLNKIFNSLSGK